MVTLDEELSREFQDDEEQARDWYTTLIAEGLVTGDADTDAFMEELEQEIEDFEAADDPYELAREKL